MKDNNKNHTTVILNLFQDLNKAIRENGQGNKIFTFLCHSENLENLCEV